VSRTASVIQTLYSLIECVFHVTFLLTANHNRNFSCYQFHAPSKVPVQRNAGVPVCAVAGAMTVAGMEPRGTGKSWARSAMASAKGSKRAGMKNPTNLEDSWGWGGR
jgi:hypothetical protein